MMSPVLTTLLEAMKFVDTKAVAATGALKHDLTKVQERGREAKKKLEAFKVRMRTEADKIQLDVLVEQCKEKAQAAEKSTAQMDTAEEPIVKGGVEALSENDATNALRECEEAA